METVVDILKISGIDIIDTNISKNVEIVQGKPRTSLGPFLPISSGDYTDKGFRNIKQKEVNGAIVYYSEWTGIGRDWLIGLLSR